MKALFRSAFAILLTVFVNDLGAQIKPVYIIGLNFSTMTIKNSGLTSHPETPVGIHFGGYVDIPLTANIDLEPSFLFSAKGTNYKIDSVNHSISPIYIEVPVMVVYSFGSGVLKFSVYGGPYFAFGIGGYKIEGEGELQYLSYGSGENHDLKPFDLGLNLGAGVRIKGFQISAQYGLGLLNVSPMASVNSEMKNKVIGISISMKNRTY